MSKRESAKVVLAVDHGTSGCKVALVTLQGEVVDFEYEATPIHFLPGGGAEQDPHDWWRALVAATRRMLGRGAVGADAVAAIGVSSTWSSTVAVDRQGEPLMRSLTWMDYRGAPYIRKLMAGFPSVQGYGLAKVLSWIRKTGGGPSLSGKDDIAHVLLTKHEHPEIYEKTYKFLGSKDYLNLKLTGELKTTFDSVMLFWATDTRDIRSIRYDEGLIRALGIDGEKLPSLAAATDLIGTLRPEAARELGLPPGVPVAGGAPDHQAALVGSGAVRDFEGHLYIGTSSWVECIVPFKKTDMLHSIASLPAAIPGKYQCVNEQDIAGGSLSFLLDKVLYDRAALLGETPQKVPYSALDEIAARAPAGSHKVLFTPWLNGERTPVDSTTLRGGLHNLSMTTTTEDMVRAFLEGVAYNTRWSFQYVEKFVGRKMDPLNMIGGGANSGLWCQIFADVLDRTIRRVKDPIQSNARGAAFLAAVGLGEITFDDIPGLIRYEGEYRPNAANRAVYEELFGEFVAIYKANKGIYGRLNRIRS